MSHRTANRGGLFVAPPAPGSPADYFERTAACTPPRQRASARRTVSARARAMTPLPARPAAPAHAPHAARLRRLDALDACDASAGIVTTIRDTVSCSWIFYSNSSASTAGEGGAPGAEPDPALDSMHMMLDPHLRPISPDLTNEESKRIFEKHKQLAQEYLKVQTELAYQSNHKNELEEKMDDDELRQKREIIQLENEKESLIKLYCSLKKQLARVENDDWLEEMPSE